MAFFGHALPPRPWTCANKRTITWSWKLSKKQHLRGPLQSTCIDFLRSLFGEHLKIHFLTSTIATGVIGWVLRQALFPLHANVVWAEDRSTVDPLCWMLPPNTLLKFCLVKPTIRAAISELLQVKSFVQRRFLGRLSHHVGGIGPKVLPVDGLEKITLTPWNIEPSCLPQTESFKGTGTWSSLCPPDWLLCKYEHPIKRKD